jgi:hypothetical protein
MTVRPPTPPPLPDELDRLLRRLRMPYVRQPAPEVLATARRSTLNKSPHGRGIATIGLDADRADVAEDRVGALVRGVSRLC